MRVTTVINIISLVERFGIWAVIALATIVVIRLVNAQKCQLRSEMLRIYYHNKDRKAIRQYEFENFIHLYKAYKALLGNSFIEKIYKEVITWDVVT